MFVSFNPRTHTGCDIPSPSAATRRSCFNPRTHTGCDLFTHLIIVLICSFQSTHPHGVRRAMTLRHRTYVVFQSTHPHGVRPKPSMTVSVYNNGFNPRTHTGCDDSNSLYEDELEVSIHAPTRGATIPCPF